MTLLWLVVWGIYGWLFNDGVWPTLQMWDGWTVALLIAVALDLADHR